MSFRMRSFVGFGAVLAVSLGLAHQAPARADSLASILLGAAASSAGIFIPNGITQTGMTNDTVVGRTADGGIVYADGRVLYQNGDVLYSSNGNGRPCGWTVGVQTRCAPTATTYYPRTYNGHDHGNHYGWYKAKHVENAGGNAYRNAKKDAKGHGHGHGNGNQEKHGHDD